MQKKYHTLYFEATRKCNLSCEHCSAGCSSGVYRSEKELSMRQIYDRILLPAKKLGTVNVDYSGGEFLMRKDAFELLEQTRSMGFGISVVSNAILLDDNMIKRIIDAAGPNVLISLGINSFNSENKETRQTSDDFVLNAIERLEKHGININICVTVGAFNKGSIADTLKRIDNMKLAYNRIPVVPRNAPCYDLMFDKEILKNYIHPELRKYYRGFVSYTPFFLDPEYYNKKCGQNFIESDVPTNPSIGCWVGSFYAINATGEVAPCPLLLDNVSGGNVMEMRLKDILYESQLFKNIVKRDQLGGKCGQCKYSFTCGGCRALAYYVNKDIYAEDPYCFIDDLSVDELRSIEEQTGRSFRNYLRMFKMAKRT